MKNVKILIAVAFAFVGVAAMAQDLSDPRYAKWGETPEDRKVNMLNSNFLKESCANRDFDGATKYLLKLIAQCPSATENIYAYGTTVYRNKINNAQDDAQRAGYVDSLLMMYDLRAKYFADHNKRGLDYILDRKAREVATYKKNDRPAIRTAFKEAIAAAQAKSDVVDPELIVLYYSNLCDDFKNTDQITPDQVIAEYDRLSPLFTAESDEFKKQFDLAFGLSGAASCENLEKLFRAKLAADPNNADLLAQAVKLMSRANCQGDFYFELSEKYYEVKPTSETAMFLAQAFQGKGDYDKASKYLHAALAVEKNAVEREKLLVRISLVELVDNDMSSAVIAARQARDLNPESGEAYFVLGQCYAHTAGNCSGIDAQASYWVAYDTMAKAVEYLKDPQYLTTAKTLLAAYRSRFPTSEECFFNEMSEQSNYTIKCGAAAGIVTKVRYK